MTNLTRTDLRILAALQDDGGLSNVALAERVGMSPSPCLRRVKQLEAEGVIRGYVAELDQRKLGFGIRAYVEVKVPQVPGIDIVESFRDAVCEEGSILSCHTTAGQFDFLLEVIARDMDEYSIIAREVLLKLPGVRDMRTTFVLETFKESRALPLRTQI